MISTYTLDSALMMAAKQKKYDLMKSYLEKGATAKTRNGGNHNTVMHMAIMNRDEKMLDLLLNYKIDLSVKNDDRLTPVALAASLGYWNDVIKIVSKHKETAGGDFGYSEALLLAVERDDANTASVLLKAGAKADAEQPGSGQTALHFAVYNRNLRMLRLLMRYQTEMWRQNSQHMNAIEYAASLDYWDCVMLIAVMSKGQKNRGYIDIGNILMLALRKKYYQHVGALLAAGANPDRVESATGETPLHIAVRDNQPAMVALLMKHKANADSDNRDGMTALFLAHKLQHWECVDAFINPDKYVPLTDAALQKKLFYLFTAHQNKANPFSAIPYDVLKMIVKESFSEYPKESYDFDSARRRYEDSREERQFLGNVSFFVQAYQSYSLLRQWTTGQSNDSIAFVEALSDIIGSRELIDLQVSAVKAEIKKFTVLKGEGKSRAMDLLKHYKLFAPAVSAGKDARPQVPVLKR